MYTIKKHLYPLLALLFTCSLHSLQAAQKEDAPPAPSLTSEVDPSKKITREQGVVSLNRLKNEAHVFFIIERLEVKQRNPKESTIKKNRSQTLSRVTFCIDLTEDPEVKNNTKDNFSAGKVGYHDIPPKKPLVVYVNKKDIIMNIPPSLAGKRDRNEIQFMYSYAVELKTKKIERLLKHVREDKKVRLSFLPLYSGRNICEILFPYLCHEIDAYTSLTWAIERFNESVDNEERIDERSMKEALHIGLTGCLLGDSTQELLSSHFYKMIGI